jgi:radical SAM protein with 4Fe4S-binding SPASM domain
VERFKEKWLAICDAVVIKPTLLGQHFKEYQHFARPDALATVRGSNLAYADISESHFERTAPCFETSRRLAINSDGNVWCSHHASEDFGPYLGNVKQQTLRQIWHGETMNAFRRQTRAGIFDRICCKECGGELIENHRVPSRAMEPHITFLPVLDRLRR